ncbi:hypothetical protein CEXT_671211 [Caerostris extrusa]|uniref:Uncharacterized protein n=1 Tax=Caerostris extrusa TaxID=172846 RepID=A0AAV4NA82_CAEEX|nr:hypothetical protein CEXT_671211 [Caerostris extrusa]
MTRYLAATKKHRLPRFPRNGTFDLSGRPRRKEIAVQNPSSPQKWASLNALVLSSNILLKKKPSKIAEFLLIS